MAERDRGHGAAHGVGHGVGHGVATGPGVHVERSEERSRLVWVLVLTAVFMAVEVVGGLLADSLALLADAGHMFTDAGSIALALAAMHFAQKPADPARTFGWVRLEILAALVNGATLLVMSGWIVVEAWERFRQPVQVDGPILLGVALAGLAVNVVAARLLDSHAHDNLNVRGAYLHVLGDLLGSVGAVVAGIVVLTTGWMPVDLLVSVLIAALILVSAWRLVREATDVLLEAAPRHVDVEEVLEDLRGIDGLDDVHDLHVWTLTSGFVALSGHGVLDDVSDFRTVLDAIRARAREHGIEHVTFQLEPRALYQVERPDG